MELSLSRDGGGGGESGAEPCADPEGGGAGRADQPPLPRSGSTPGHSSLGWDTAGTATPTGVPCAL